MTDTNECRQKAQTYEYQAKRVSDPWVKERLYVLARYWRELAKRREISPGQNDDRTASRHP
ncbi:MAG TPA: hypothetical protein VH684_21980 [Xanthobacteraceae bacterium]|jgi:hypothetical protein